MAVDQRSHSSHRGGRLLDAIRRAEATLGQPPSGHVPGDEAAQIFLAASPEPAAYGAPVESVPELPVPSPASISGFVEPQAFAPPPLDVAAPFSPLDPAPAPLVDPYVPERSPAEPVAASPEAIVAAPSVRMDLPRFTLNLPRWPEIEDLAKTIVGDFPELVSAVLACASIDRPAAGSLVAAPLARALAARQGEQVLLVESDVYASLRATGTFYQPKPGLAEIFTKQIAWSDALLPTAIERLAYLPAGLDARAFPIDGDLATQLFDELKRRFRYVVIDAGPAAEALAAGWLERCDEIYLAVELGRTAPHRARDVARQIVAAGGKVRGAVVLDVAA